jgi:arylsulfatase A-like enzyme
MQFTDAYAGYSVCAPSRRTLMTGYHTGHFETGDSPTMLTNRSTTVAAILARNGYATRLIGKWGLDGNFQVRARPPRLIAATARRTFPSPTHFRIQAGEALERERERERERGRQYTFIDN